MTQEQKELLIKDLCARLGTNLVCSIYRTDDYGVGYRDEILSGYCKGDIWYEFYFGDDCGIVIDDVSKIKPYLLPITSMTAEQREEYRKVCELDTEILSKHPMDGSPFPAMYNSQDWLDANNFDYRGLIPRLAIDATGKDIY
jgi:hypothetical protein